MKIETRHNFILYPFFSWYGIIMTRLKFRKVELIDPPQNDNRPILLLSNHISWWDGFWAVYLNHKLFGRRFHFMMDEINLNKNWFFKYCGGFPVQKRSRSIIDSLAFTLELLQKSDNMVLLFPQGIIESQQQQTIHFDNGVNWLIKNRKNNFRIIFMACMVDYFSHAKPSLYLYLEEHQPTSGHAEGVAQAYQEFYNRSVKRQTKQNLKP